MATGKKSAKAAGKLLSSKGSSAKVKEVAASDLAQARNTTQKKPKKQS